MPARRPSVAALLATLRPTCAAPRLVHDGEGADPMVLAEGDTCHLYTTNAGLENVPHFTAPALDGWTHRGDALPALGAWAVGGHTWAPAVSRTAAGYLLYYSAREGTTGRHAIGLARGAAPGGPFTDDAPAPFLTDPDGAIDAEVFVDDDDARYLLCKTDGNSFGRPAALWLQPLAPDGLSTTGPATRLLSSGRAWEGGVVESPVLRKRDGLYYLFYSLGDYTGTAYNVGVAVAAAPTGPYIKGLRPLLATGRTGLRGPGGQSLLHWRGRDWLVFHSFDPVHAYRAVWTAELRWRSSPRLGWH